MISLVNILLLSILTSYAVTTVTTQFTCEVRNNSKHNQGVYTIYDEKNHILHVLSFAGEPTFLIFNTTTGARSLKYEWNAKSGEIENVSLSNYSLLYGFVVRNIIEFKVAGGGINFDINKLNKTNENSTLFNTYSLSNLMYNLTELKECNSTGKIRVSLQQKNNTNTTQFNFIFDIQAYLSEGRLSNQPRYSFRGNNSVIDFIITGFPFNLTDKNDPSSRLALELDFIRRNGTQLFHSSVRNIDDEYTPAVFLQDTVQMQGQPKYFYWKPISYADASRSVESSMRVTYLNGTLSPPAHLNTTGFFNSLERNISLTLERSLFIFGTEGDSNLNLAYVFFRAELGLGQPPTDVISLPLVIAIGVGFGLPVFGLLLGLVGICLLMAYKCFSRASTKNVRYVMIN